MADKTMHHVVIGSDTYEIVDSVARVGAEAAFATDTASGSIATFPDGADGVPVKSLSVAVEAVQSGSGDPSPTNIREISGWDAVKVCRAGKNLIKYTSSSQTTAGVTFTHNDDGTITVNGTATDGDATHYVISKANMTACGFMGLKGQEVIENGCPSGGSSSTYFMQWARLDGSTIATDFGEGATVTIGDYDTASSTYACIVIKSGYTADNLVFKPMVRFSSETDATYEPYNGTVYDINLPQTVYGGTLDVSTGVLTVDHAIVDMGTLTYSYASAGSYFRTASLEHSKAAGKENLICSCYKLDTAAVTYMANYSIKGVDGDGGIYIKNTDYTSGANLKAALNGMQLVYELATPTTLTLTPEQVTTLLGQNNIYADAGSVAVTYRADTGLYIDKRLNA